MIRGLVQASAEAMVESSKCLDLLSAQSASIIVSLEESERGDLGPFQIISISFPVN